MSIQQACSLQEIKKTSDIECKNATRNIAHSVVDGPNFGLLAVRDFDV